MKNRKISIDRNSAKQNGSRSARHTKKKGMSMLINACLCRSLRKLTAHANATHMRNNMIRDKCCCLKKGSNKTNSIHIVLRTRNIMIATHSDNIGHYRFSPWYQYILAVNYKIKLRLICNIARIYSRVQCTS
jgi:hypothetical protein